MCTRWKKKNQIYTFSIWGKIEEILEKKNTSIKIVVSNSLI